MSTAFGGLVLGAATADALTQTRYVATTGNDVTGNGPNTCSVAAAPCRTIQHGVDEAAAGDTVSVAAGHYTESVQIHGAVTIRGAGPGTVVTGVGTGNTAGPAIAGLGVTGLVLTDLSISGSQDAPGVETIASTVTVSDAVVSGNAFAGILSLGGTLTVTDTTVADTAQSDSGNAPNFADGSGIAAVGTAVTVERSTLRDNEGSGLATLDLSQVPSVATPAAPPNEVASADITASTVSGNQNGGVLSDLSTTTVTRSTLTNNVGAGLVLLGGTAGVVDSTVTGTTPFDDSEGDTSEQGGIVAIPAEQQQVQGSTNRLVPTRAARRAYSAELAHVLAGHGSTPQSATRTPRPAPSAPSTNPTVTVSGSIVAKNAPLGDCFGPVVSGGYNLSSDAKNSCEFSAAKHDLIKTDPKLGALGNHGGPTATLVPLKGSPAIDAVPAAQAGCTTGADDQRGTARPQPTGGRCDIGAVELAAEPIVIHPATLPHGTVGRAYKVTISATGGQYPSYTWSLAPGTTLPAGLTFSSAGVLSGTPTKAGSYQVTVSVNDPTEKAYTLVIAAGAAPDGNGASPVANTGAPTASLTAVGVSAVLLGLLLLASAGLIGRRRGLHRL